MREDRPSRSAAKVGQVMAYLARDARYAGLLPEGLAETTEELLAAAGALKPWHLRLIGSGWYRWLTRRVEGLAMPGHFLYLGLRKRFIHDQAVAALEEGAFQVLVIGAGMDTLCLRLAERSPDVAFVEVDHPASQHAKRRAVEVLGPAPDNLHFVPADLAAPDASLDRVLAGCRAWRPDARSFVVTEGLLMYLPEDAVRRLADGIHDATRAGSRWLLTTMVRGTDGTIEMGRRPMLTGAGMKLSGEPIIWGVRPAELPDFLAARGFRLLGPREGEDLRSRYLEPAALADHPLGDLERIAVAERLDDR